MNRSKEYHYPFWSDIRFSMFLVLRRSCLKYFSLWLVIDFTRIREKKNGITLLVSTIVQLVHTSKNDSEISSVSATSLINVLVNPIIITDPNRLKRIDWNVSMAINQSPRMFRILEATDSSGSTEITGDHRCSLSIRTSR